MKTMPAPPRLAREGFVPAANLAIAGDPRILSISVFGERP